MPNTVRRWVILGTALAASVTVAFMFRPADTLGEDPIVHRDDRASKAVQRLSTILQPDATSLSKLNNPFHKPGESVVVQPKQDVEKPPTVGAQMTGWARLNNTDYALITISSGELYVQVGDKVADWLVTQVTPEQTVFTRGGMQEIVRLKESFSVTP